MPPLQPMEPFQMPQLLLQQQPLQGSVHYPLASTEDDGMNSLLNFSEEDEYGDDVDEDTKPKKK